MARFATSARAVDMLGRQQIANIPTALSELFKNAHDAYAERVRADYFPEARSLLLRDDGVGMSRQDFLDRWLVLGTDSKAADSSRPPPPRPEGARPRSTMGEKGIGRLAIASIGPQVAVVTRPHSGSRRPIVVALVQWSMFAIPGLLLDDVEVPMIESGHWPEQADLDALCEAVDANLAALKKRVPAHLAAKVREELAELRLPTDVAKVAGPHLEGDGHGTHFLIAPVHAELDAVMTPTTAEEQANRSTNFERLLIGFTNTMLPGVKRSPMRASFFVHRSGSAAQDLIAPKVFWEPDDFDQVDHDIEGEFDESGRFVGTVSVYGHQPVEHVVAPAPGAHKPPRCGPFKIRIGYLQGDPKESRLDPSEYVATQTKLARIGGLYVYRDGIRVLPYGSADVDYLAIEERRSRNAGRYYFSYRRMFGAIEITSEHNPSLRDKAGREGFLENVAFRDFKALLEHFLMQTAADFFRKGGEQAEDFTAERARLRELERQRRLAAAEAQRRREAFVSTVQERLDELESGRAAQHLDRIVVRVREQLDAGRLDVDALAALEKSARDEIDAVSTGLMLLEPDLPALNDDQTRDLSAYRARLEVFQLSTVPQAVAQVVALVEAAAGSRGLKALATARLSGFNETAQRAVDKVRSAADETTAEAAALAERIRERVAELVQEVEGILHDVRKELADTHGQGSAFEQQVGLLRVQRSASEHAGNLVRLRRRIDDVLSDEAAEEARLLQERLISLEKQVDADVDLLLLGQAVQVIDHELEQTVGAARDALARLRPLSRRDEALRRSVAEASSAFEHLDGYLRLFAPLQRRLRRQRTDIPGTRVVAFLRSLLAERLRRHDVELRATRAFRESVIVGFASTFLPVFVNVVDNAIYWATCAHPDGGGVVELDLDGGDPVVRDNGPGVPARDLDVIFTSGFSRRVGGRGLGLSISREALRREGWDLSADPPARTGGGAVFRLHRPDDE